MVDYTSQPALLDPTRAARMDPANITAIQQPLQVGQSNLRGRAPPAPNAIPTATSAPLSPSQWNVDSNQTVQGQVKNIIDANSPLMQQAETRSLQKSNDRGLINSSISVGAGQGALYDAAMLMAAADASMYGRSAEVNNAVQNQFKTAANAQSYDLAKMSTTQEFDLAKMAETQKNQTLQLTQKYGYDKDLLNIQSESAKETANIAAKYRNLTQASASATSMINNSSDHIHSIMMNPDLDGPAKQAAIDSYNANLNKSLQLIGSMAGDVDLSNLLESLLA